MSRVGSRLAFLLLLPAAAFAQSSGGRADAVKEWLKGYDVAFNAKDLRSNG